MPVRTIAPLFDVIRSLTSKVYHQPKIIHKLLNWWMVIRVFVIFSQSSISTWHKDLCMLTIYCHQWSLSTINSKLTPAVKINNFMIMVIYIYFPSYHFHLLWINKNVFTASVKYSFTAYVGNLKIPYYHSQKNTIDLIFLNHHQILKTFEINIEVIMITT